MLSEAVEKLLGCRQEEPRSLIHNSPDTPFQTTYRIGDILDEKKLDRETREMTKSLKKIQDGMEDLQIRAKTPQDVKAWGRWQEDQKKVWKVVGALASLDVNTNPDSATHRTFTVVHFLNVGGEVLVHELVDNERRYAKRQGFDGSLEPYLALQEFLISGRSLSIRIGSCALKDFLEESQTLRPTPDQAYEFLMESYLVRMNRSHRAVLATRQDPFWSSYPNRAIAAIEELTGRVMALTGAFPKVIDDILVQSKGLNGEVARRAEKLYRRIQDSRHDFFLSLLQPSSDGHNLAAAAMMPYLRQGRAERTLALSIAGVSVIDQLYKLYRRSQELAVTGPHAEFYQFLLESIDKYMVEVPSSDQVLTAEDLDSVFDEEMPEYAEAPGLDVLGRIVSAAFEKSANREFDIQIEDIVWGRLVPPQSVTIGFDKNRPQKFAICLFYQSEQGESKVITFSLDTKKNLLDWNIINSPNESRLSEFRKTALLVTKEILLQVQAEAERRFLAKQSKREIRLTSMGENKPKERFTDETYQMKKQVLAEARARISVEEQMVLPNASEEKVKKMIVVPGEEVLQAFLRSLSSVDREIIMRGIDRFNHDGVGEFKKERSIGKAGVALYALRINCTAPKGVRVLLTLLPSTKGEMSFEIVDIDYRRDIFRKAGI